MYSHFLIFAFLVCFWCHMKNIYVVAKTSVKELFPYVFFKEFHGFRSYIYVFNPFQVNFYLLCKIRFQFHSFAYEYPVFPVPYIEGTILPLLYSLETFVVGCIHMGLFLVSLFCFIGLCVCFYASVILFWFLYLLSVFYSSGPQPFWHQVPVSWKAIFPRMGGDCLGGNASNGEQWGVADEVLLTRVPVAHLLRPGS